ncbi:UDP-N-acetylmuramoyl-tripeptide--D-alanyl-D-alanine ligase [Patescibacteria group bacterium]|nr:UDP-N-acetylmuramoyl-tripeptide--D-alanyl-D-alanine ligase [Patescibacteria group bacterium]
MLFLLSFLWFFRTTKVILFYLYLWQLKEYHIGRFIDHFRTEKGMRLILSPLIFLKLCLIGFVPLKFFSISLIFIYLLESAQAFKNFSQKKLRFPILTKKTVFLILAALILEIVYLYSISSLELPRFSFHILLFDIIIPIITTAIVLFFQPIAALVRWQIIQKAKKKREKFKDLLVIGITGSYGKTSTKEFLTEILSERFRVLKTLEHQNSEVGISQCILNDLNKEHQIFVVEMGAYNKGGIKLLCDIARPKIGILAGINEQHMATFGSQENIIRTKYELIESLSENGLSIFNGSNPYTFRLYLKTKKPKRVYRFRTTTNHIQPDIFAKNIKVEKDFISFRIFTKNEKKVDFKVNLLGAQNVPNLLGAVLVAKELGMSFEEIKKACQKIKPWQSGIKLLKGKNGLNIIDSTYSANPNGVIAHLDYLKIWKGKKIIVMPCLIELGKASKEVHKRIGQKIGKVCNLAIITTKERFKEIKEGTLKSGMLEEKILFLEDSKKIFERIKTYCQPGDVILLESRVPKGVIELLSD